MNNNKDNGKRGFFSSRANIVHVGFFAVGGYFLITEHGAHLIPFLPWLLILACPLTHFFMHGGHGGHHGAGDGARPSSDDNQISPHQRRRDANQPGVPNAR